jgi:uncharacterized membrane protein YgdD (TMEM256/DUF423 family)
MTAADERVARRLVAIGALSAALAVAAGAFGAHALADAVTEARLGTWQTASSYHLAHALGLVLVGLAMLRWPSRATRAAGGLLLAGTVLFSGSLYALVLLDAPALGAITPLGGVAFIAGWVALARAAWPAGPDES